MRPAGAGWGSMRSIRAQHGAGVIIRGVRNRSDFLHEYRLAAMNQDLGITTLLLPAKPSLVSVSSSILRGLGG
jgi:pantetheine-phosphate adenylyltransferase